MSSHTEDKIESNHYKNVTSDTLKVINAERVNSDLLVYVGLYLDREKDIYSWGGRLYTLLGNEVEVSAFGCDDTPLTVESIEAVRPERRDHVVTAKEYIYPYPLRLRTRRNGKLFEGGLRFSIVYDTSNTKNPYLSRIVAKTELIDMCRTKGQ